MDAHTKCNYHAASFRALHDLKLAPAPTRVAVISRQPAGSLRLGKVVAKKKKKKDGNRSTPEMPHVQTPEESQAPTSMILVGLAFRHARDSRRARRQKQAARKRKGSVCLDQLARAAEYRVPHSQRMKMHVGDWALGGRPRMKCLSDRRVPTWRTCPDGTAWSPQLAGGGGGCPITIESRTELCPDASVRLRSRPKIKPHHEPRRRPSPPPMRVVKSPSRTPPPHVSTGIATSAAARRPT